MTLVFIYEIVPEGVRGGLQSYTFLSCIFCSLYVTSWSYSYDKVEGERGVGWVEMIAVTDRLLHVWNILTRQQMEVLHINYRIPRKSKTKGIIWRFLFVSNHAWNIFKSLVAGWKEFVILGKNKLKLQNCVISISNKSFWRWLQLDKDKCNKEMYTT